MLLGGQTSTNLNSRLLKLKEAAAPIVVCATGKYIGEGFDDARLDTLFLTMPISWQGTLAQYVGRLHRLHEDKREVCVYDYIDSHAAMLEKMYHKRLKGYANLGYGVSAERNDAIGGDVIFDRLSFQDRFLQDVGQAKNSVRIVSPYASASRVTWLIPTIAQGRQRRVKFSITTRPPDSLPATSRKTAQAAFEQLQEQGCDLLFRTGIYQRYAIIDDRIIWYGSINLLSIGKAQATMMRLVSSNIARELMKMEKPYENHEAAKHT